MIIVQVLRVGVVKTGSNCCSSVRKDSISSMSRLPCLGAHSVCKLQTGCQIRARKPTPSSVMRYSSGRNVAETGPSYTSTHAWRNAAKNAKLELRRVASRHKTNLPFLPKTAIFRSEVGHFWTIGVRSATWSKAPRLEGKDTHCTKRDGSDWPP